MSSPELKRVLRLSAVFAVSLAVAGCFRPVYGGGAAPGVTSKTASLDVEQAMKSVDVKPIDGRVAQKMRNELIFFLRGGAGQGQVAYRLEVLEFLEAGQSAVVDPLTSVPQTRTISLTVRYELRRAGTLDAVATGNAFANATYFSGLQRFANVRAERDAEDRAATQIAQQIRNRVQGYFATGR